MTEVLTAVDVVGLSIAYLSDQGMVAHKRVPNPRPDTPFVTLQLAGGTRGIVTDKPTVVVSGWAGSDSQAHDTAQQARALMHALQGTVLDGTQVYRVDEFGGPVDDTDPVSKQSRFTFRLSLSLRLTRA